jgi:hypothetical protein
VPNSVLEAIKLGFWDFEPERVASHRYDSTKAMPGTKQKLDILAERVSRGLPLWHPSDRSEYDDPPHRKSDADPATLLMLLDDDDG